MKHLFLLLAICIPTIIHAEDKEQQNEEITVFAQIMGINKNVLGLGSRVSVEIDFGEEKTWYNDGRDILIDDDGKELKFNSMVDAMNFMGKHGWVYEDSYVITVANQNVIHWLLSKKIKEGDSVKGNIKQKRDKKKKKTEDSKESRFEDPLYN